MYAYHNMIYAIVALYVEIYFTSGLWSSELVFLCLWDKPSRWDKWGKEDTSICIYAFSKCFAKSFNNWYLLKLYFALPLYILFCQKQANIVCYILIYFIFIIFCTTLRDNQCDYLFFPSEIIAKIEKIPSIFVLNLCTITLIIFKFNFSFYVSNYLQYKNNWINLNNGYKRGTF